MKKMFFTAIALLAFTAVSMANTKEVKTAKSVKSKITKVVIKKETPQCYYGWIAVYQAAGIEAADAWGAAHGC